MKKIPRDEDAWVQTFRCLCGVAFGMVIITLAELRRFSWWLPPLFFVLGIIMAVLSGIRKRRVWHDKDNGMPDL
ncbi:hypothetical protein [Paraburkholderia sp.]|uniref:hypothetical protein n=1 Tax=Paraburkholderia sp. TaxID=1926495 RepID=UPI0039E2F7A5